MIHVVRDSLARNHCVSMLVYTREKGHANTVKQKIGFQDRLSLNAGQSIAKLREHSAILSAFIKLPFVFKTFVLSIFE